MPKKKEITNALVSNEFIDKIGEDTYTGQTIEVQSKTKLEEDLGTGEALVLRTYEFKTNPELLQPNIQFPSAQELFMSHLKGIAGMLWQDGLTPAIDLEPRLILSRDKATYLIMVWARSQRGQLALEKHLVEQAKTLSEIAKETKIETRNNPSEISRELQLSPTKKKKTKRTA